MNQGRTLKIANVVMAVVFAAFTVVQVNDPDSLAWILLYGAAAACCVLFVFGRLSPTFGGALAVLALVWALFLGYYVL
ncbi:MAG TPA: transmembrane 220 family protein, partial [Rhodothermales bacterium]